MNSLLIVIFISFIHNCCGQCTPLKPFLMNDISCAGFNDICMKNDNPQCKSLLDACQQCPPNNITVVAMLDLTARIRDQVLSNREFMRNISNQLVAVKNKSDITFGLLIFLIVVLLILLIIILILEVRFKCIGNSCRGIKTRDERPIMTYENARTPSLDRISTEHTMNFQIKGVASPIQLKISEDDNVVRVKQKICAKWTASKPSDLKLMKLRINNVTLDDNEYLYPRSNSSNATILCEINEKMNASDVVILQLSGNRRLPEMMQADLAQSINDFKSTIFKLVNLTEFKIFKDSKELVELTGLKDYDWIQVIAVEKTVLTISSIFDDVSPVTIGFSNVDSVSSVKVKLGKELNSNPNDLILFANNKYLEETEFIFQIDSGHGPGWKYCYLVKFKIVPTTGEVIKSGYFSDIIEGNHPLTNEEMILKRYELQSPKNVKFKAFLNELITFQITKSHPGLVHVSRVFKDDKFAYIGMEKMVGGSVKDFLKSKAPLSTQTIAKWAKQILEALKHLHDNNIIHRNVQPSSILIDKNRNVKLSSFGLSKYVQGGDTRYLMIRSDHSGIEIYRYTAPEVCEEKPYGVQADVWSFGATFGEIATGKRPCDDKADETAALIEIGNSKTITFELDDSSKELKDFINACLIGDPQKRATVETLLQHDFLRQQ